MWVILRREKSKPQKGTEFTRYLVNSVPLCGLSQTRSRDRGCSGSDNVTGNNHLDTPVELAPGSRIVGRNRLALAHAARDDQRRIDSLLSQKIANRLGAAFR